LETPDEFHYDDVADAIREGEVIPFLGAGVNLCDRGVVPEPWEPCDQLPSGGELAEWLAKLRKYPPQEARDLLRVAQYVGVTRGWLRLYNDLREVFKQPYRPNSVHAFLARLPRVLRDAGVPQQLVITTNYDDALEQAYDTAREPYDVVYYAARKGQHGKFFHRPPREPDAPADAPPPEPQLIDVPNEYTGLDLDERPVILKIHGAVDRTEPTRDSYVITEDDYISYLARDEMRSFSALKGPMQQRSFLFLGYSLQDWNLRVILNRIWDESGAPMRSWAIQKPDPKRSSRSLAVERKLWDDRGDVDLLFADLAEYVRELGRQIPDPQPAAAAQVGAEA
jgi:NAD-dependent SIR2 family protein deacetylase